MLSAIKVTKALIMTTPPTPITSIGSAIGSLLGYTGQAPKNVVLSIIALHTNYAKPTYETTNDIQTISTIYIDLLSFCSVITRYRISLCILLSYFAFMCLFSISFFDLKNIRKGHLTMPKDEFTALMAALAKENLAA
jgi:hypothetical protein